MQKKKDKKQAAALQYDNLDSLPRVLVKGTGPLAELIEQLAVNTGVPIAKDSELISILTETADGAEVPPETFQILGEIFAFLFQADKEWREQHQALAPVLDPTKSLP